jgi:O-antigen/teichoic acid export membrane protein
MAGLGIDAILSREILLDEQKKSKYLGSSLYIYIFSALAAFLSVNMGALIYEKDAYVQFLIFIFSLTLFFQATGVFNTYFLSYVKAKELAILQIISNVVSTALKVFGFLFGFGLVWFISLFVVDAILYLSLSLLTFKKLNGHIDWGFDFSLIKGLVYKSLPFMLSIVAASIYMKIDQVMIRSMLGNSETGVYSVAVKLAEMWYFVPSLICASLFPAIVNAKKISISLYYSRVTSLIVLMMITSLFFVVPLFLASGYIVHSLYGSAYAGAIEPFRVYIWSSLSIFIMPALSAFITTENLGTKLLFSTVAGAIVNVLLNLVLIPVYGILGAAMATAVSYAIPALYLYLVFIKLKKKAKLDS